MWTTRIWQVVAGFGWVVMALTAIALPSVWLAAYVGISWLATGIISDQDSITCWDLLVDVSLHGVLLIFLPLLTAVVWLMHKAWVSVPDLPSPPTATVQAGEFNRLPDEVAASSAVLPKKMVRVALMFVGGLVLTFLLAACVFSLALVNRSLQPLQNSTDSTDGSAVPAAPSWRIFGILCWLVLIVVVTALLGGLWAIFYDSYVLYFCKPLSALRPPPIPLSPPEPNVV